MARTAPSGFASSPRQGGMQGDLLPAPQALPTSCGAQSTAVVKGAEATPGPADPLELALAVAQHAVGGLQVPGRHPRAGAPGRDVANAAVPGSVVDVAVHENVDAREQGGQAFREHRAPQGALERSARGGEPAGTKSIQRTQRRRSPIDEVLERKEGAPHAVVALPDPPGCG